MEENGKIKDQSEREDEVGVCWRQTGDRSYEAKIGSWSCVICQDDSMSSHSWKVSCTHTGGHNECWWNCALAGAQKSAVELCGPEAPDFLFLERRDNVVLANAIYCFNLLGLGEAWQSHEPDTGDERYRRCLAVATAVLDRLEDEGAPVVPGEPLDATDDLIFSVYVCVRNFVFDKMQALDRGGTSRSASQEWRSWLRSSGDAARRAVATLFGEEAVPLAQGRMDAVDARTAAAMEAAVSARTEGEIDSAKSDAELAAEFEAELEASG